MVGIAMLLTSALLLSSLPAFAWDGLGHEAVCELAFREMDDTARQRVIALIKQDREFTTFRASCNWPDLSRQRAPEHFVNLARDATGLERDECPLAYECVVSAIEEDFAVLASSEATDQEKLAALKFLGHWVGDIHEPLHAGFQDDRGGNRVRTQGSSCENLHGLWDRCIVEERLGMHPLTIVSELQAGITDEQRTEWWASDAVAWANESVAIARDPDDGYCLMVGDACQCEADNRQLDDGEPQKLVVTDGGYLDSHAPVVRERIAMAGVRLAGLVNRALGDQRSEISLRAELLAQIETISRELAELREAVESLGEP
jgi:S1/P1 Nuclease